MKNLSQHEFREYIKENYFNECGVNIDDMPKETIPFIYSFQDPWFYTVGDIFYTLHIMGFQVGYKESAFVFTNVNKEICSQIKRYDKLLHVNYGEAEKKEVIVLTIESEEGEEKEIVLKIPRIMKKDKEVSHIEDSYETGYIKINSFSLIEKQSLCAFLKGKRRIMIDLRENMGGPINDMIGVLNLFTKTEQELLIKDARGKVRCKKIVTAHNDISDLREVSFQISSITASSAEIFLLMIRGMYPGIIYGSKTVGKWLIQDFVTVEGTRVAVPVYGFIPPKHYCGERQVHIDERHRIIADYKMEDAG